MEIIVAIFAFVWFLTALLAFVVPKVERCLPIDNSNDDFKKRSINDEK
jgi:hypothetical protein